MDREDVVYVLEKMSAAVKPGGLILDLQVIRPNPVVEAGGAIICEIDGERLFRSADDATAAIDALVASGRLIERAADDHDVRKHYGSGIDLIADFDESEKRRISDAAKRVLRNVGACATRERCRVRCLVVSG